MSPVLKHSTLMRGGSLDRIDAEFFDEQRIGVETTLKEHGGVLLGSQCELSENRVPDPRKEAKAMPTIRYVEIGNVDPRDGFVLANSTEAAHAPSRARMALHKDMVGLSSVRPIRSQVFMVTDDLEGCVGTSGFILLRRLDQALSPELLLAALKTRHVIAQLDRRARASMYPTLHPPDVLSVTLPRLPKSLANDIQRLMNRALKQRVAFLARAAKLDAVSGAYFKTMNPTLLLRDLEEGAATTRQLESLRNPDGLGRIDSEFHASAFDGAIARMAAVGATSELGGLLSAASTGTSPGSEEYSDADPGGGCAIIKVGALTSLGINWAALSYAPKSYAEPAANRIVEGDIVFTSTAHQPKYMAHKVDVVSAIPPGIEDRLSFVGELMRVRVADQETLPPHYLAAFLRNPLGKEQVRRCIRGISSHVYPADVKRITIPIPPRAVAQKIAHEAQKLQSARWEYTRQVRLAIEKIEAYVDGLTASDSDA